MQITTSSGLELEFPDNEKQDACFVYYLKMARGVKTNKDVFDSINDFYELVLGKENTKKLLLHLKETSEGGIASYKDVEKEIAEIINAIMKSKKNG